MKNRTERRAVGKNFNRQIGKVKALADQMQRLERMGLIKKKKQPLHVRLKAYMKSLLTGLKPSRSTRVG